MELRASLGGLRIQELQAQRNSKKRGELSEAEVAMLRATERPRKIRMKKWQILL